MGELFGVKCTHYITYFDELYYYAPIDSLEFHSSRCCLLKHETKTNVGLAINGKHVLIDKSVRDHMKELTSEVNDGYKALTLFSTHLGDLALLSAPMFEKLSAIVNKRIKITDLRYYSTRIGFNL